MIVGVRHHDLLLRAEAEAVRGVELPVGLTEAAELAPIESQSHEFIINSYIDIIVNQKLVLSTTT